MKAKGINPNVIIRKYAMVFIFILLFIIFSIMNPSFCSLTNIRNLIVQNSYILVAGVGVSFVMMSGTLDLSVGYQVAAIGVLAGRMMKNEIPVGIVIVCCLLFGMLLGFINGGAAVLFKIDPLIVSIATMTAFQGVANLISGGLSYNNFPDVFRVITRGSLFGIPMDVWIAIIAVAVASLVYNFTYYGRFVKAMGGNPEALTRIANISLQALGQVIFSASGGGAKSAEEIFRTDYKEFHIAGHNLAVSQVTCMDSDQLLQRKGEFLQLMSSLQKKQGFDMVILMITDVLLEGTQLLFVGDRDSIRQAFNVEDAEDVVFLPKVMSRKKQVIPMLSALWG